MQIPGQNAEAPLGRQISRRENAMKLCPRAISVNDEKRFSGIADLQTIEGGMGTRQVQAFRKSFNLCKKTPSI